MSDAVPLNKVPRLGLAEIVEVIGDDATSRRLTDLGFMRGTRIRVLRTAPLGDPTVYELRNYEMCLRRSEAERVRVKEVAE